ncbi:HAD-like protein [Dentipellis sp. KUC8613]|nr:HAD-like protein [Dentipellis sp. KUC8613]
MSSIPRCTTLILDIGDVLFTWSPKTTTTISPRTLKNILSSPTWHKYECGRISQDHCYRLVGEQFSIDPQELAQAFEDARDSLQPDNDFIHFVRALKTESQGKLRVFAMSNISQPDYEVLRTKPADWAIFDDIFTSAGAGMRKPNLSFYKHVLEKTGTDARTAAFVDDKLDNVLSARSLGLHGVVFDSAANVRQALRCLVSDPISRGQTFLHKRAGRLESVTNTGLEIGDNFAQLLILEATNDRSLVNYVEHSHKWNFFREKPVLTTDDFPYDLDTTSIGLTVTQPGDETMDSVMNEMLQYRDEDSIIQTYFDHERPRMDPVVCVNVLSLFYSRQRGSELPQTLDWVRRVLENRAYLEGTRYYETAECFLYFLSRLLETAKDDKLDALLKPLLKERLQERIGASGDALALAMRVVACATVGIPNEMDLRQLLPLQCEDGGWPAGWVYKYGSSGVKIGNRGLTTALALNAIRAVDAVRTRRIPPTIETTRSVQFAPSAEI